MSTSHDGSGPAAHRPRPHELDRRVRAAAWGFSIVLHAVLIGLYSVSANGWRPFSNSVSTDATSRPVEGMQVVRMVEVSTSDPAPEAPLEEELEEVEAEPDPAPASPATDVESEATVPDPIHVAEILDVGAFDPELWVTARPDLLELTAEERMALELAGRIEVWNDSIALAVAAEVASMDWTKTDAEGNRWGVSPGKLHLGSITIPLPFGFGPNPWQAGQLAKRQAREQDVVDHVQAQSIRATWKERAEAIRRRKDRERERAGRHTKPDTTRAGRSGGGG